MRSFAFLRLVRAVRLVRVHILSAFSYKKNMLYFHENHNETIHGGELVLYAEAATKVVSQEVSWTRKQMPHAETRADPRTTNPQCYGDRRSLLRNPTAQVPRGNQINNNNFS